MGFSANDDEWHHICSTWENTGGSWNLYIDGTSMASGDDFMTGHVINSGGIVILGQDQDEYGGGFEQEQSFFGEMFGANLWHSALPAEEIARMSEKCSFEMGNGPRWIDFKPGLHGDVYITSPTTCSP